MAVEHLNGTGEARRFMGVRYEPSISMGTILLMLGYLGSAALFWVNQEHRVTHLEDAQEHTQQQIDGRITARAVTDARVSDDMAKMQTQINDLGLRVYKLEIDPKRK